MQKISSCVPQTIELARYFFESPTDNLRNEERAQHQRDIQSQHSY